MARGTLTPPGSPRVAAATALAALPAVSLDLETTGLDVASDRIVQIGVVAMQGTTILESPRMDQRINPGVPIPETSSRIHGLTDDDVADAPRFADAIEQLREIIADRVVIGHNVAFDLAVLRYEAARAELRWDDPPSLDIALLAAALEPALGDVGLDSLAQGLGISITRRHDALGDSLAAAEIFAHLLPRLREADVRTFGEAQALAERRSDLIRRHTEAGWHGAPGRILAAPSVVSLARVDSYIYARRLDDVMQAPPVMTSADTTIREAARIMVDRRIGALLVGDDRGKPEGIVTERDLLRASADPSIDPDSVRVEGVMTAPVRSMPAHEMLYRALGRMDAIGIRHLCVVDTDGNAVGIVSQRDLLHHRARAAVALGDRIADARGADELAGVHSELPPVAAGLVAEGLNGVDVARVVSNELRALTSRAAELAVEQMSADGKGRPPARWCVLVLGSGGRGESLLSADQDNALIHDGTDADDSWFADMGARLAELLDQAGIPLCQGGVMAANAEWRGTIAGWRERVAAWLERARPEDLLNVDIFFDLFPVAGDAVLGRELHDAAVEAASRSPTFTALLAKSVASMSMPIDFFGRLRAQEGRVDLKIGGLLPLVSLARALALRSGSTARATPERLRDARAAGRIAAGDASTMIEIHVDLMTMMLRQQLADLDSGVRPSSRVSLKLLEREEQRRLTRALKRLENILSLLHTAMMR
ncbi:MAG: DUF294 nucleotidyltransferase-like domain-containing protein [Gammaproteobacteria bacterium]|nr:DUF294 nucleotidyltransferase-like domain-containing protein [Gammaproteobacteria bacterium]